VRSQVVSRHIKYILMISITFSLYVLNIIDKDFRKEKANGTFSLVAALLLASQGIWLSILRLSEPAVLKTVKA